MKAIYGRKLYDVARDTGEGVELIPVEGHVDGHKDEVLYVGYDNSELILNPSNDELEDIGYEVMYHEV